MDGNAAEQAGATPFMICREPGAVARVLLVACVTTLPLPCAGQVYKWVDEKGVTQYSEKPPPGTKAQAINTPSARSSLEDKDKPKPQVKSWQQQELEFRQRQVEAEENRQKREAEEAKALRQAGIRREACIEARRDLSVLQEKRPVYDLDERGQRRYLQDKERADTIKKAQQFIEKNCPK